MARVLLPVSSLLVLSQSNNLALRSGLEVGKPNTIQIDTDTDRMTEYNNTKTVYRCIRSHKYIWIAYSKQAAALLAAGLCEHNIKYGGCRMQQGTLTGLDTETDFTYTGHARVRKATVAACILYHQDK